MTRPSLFAVATFLTLLPVTLLVPGAAEIVAMQGGTDRDVTAFLVENMVAGAIAVPVVMALLRRGLSARRALTIALIIDGAAFVSMALSPSMLALHVARVVEGAAHLPAVTLLVISMRRLTTARHGRAMGALAAASMLGVALGAPLGGELARSAAVLPLWTGAVILVAALALVGTMEIPSLSAERPSRPRARDMRSTVAVAGGFVERGAIGVFVVAFPRFLQIVHAADAAHRGWLIGLLMLSFVALCYPAGLLVDRIGWLAPLVAGMLLFSASFASYGVIEKGVLPFAMITTGIGCALMYTANLVVVGRLGREHGHEGLLGAYHVAGALGFIAGPIIGGVAVAWAGPGSYGFSAVFGVAGALVSLYAAVAYLVLRPMAVVDHQHLALSRSDTPPAWLHARHERHSMPPVTWRR